MPRNDVANINGFGRISKFLGKYFKSTIIFFISSTFLLINRQINVHDN